MSRRLGFITKVNHFARLVRKELESKYGTGTHDLMGKCIEATDKLVDLYRKAGLRAEAKQVWVLYENFESCTNCCYEEHWITVVYDGSQKLYVDTTMSQFQWAFTVNFTKVFISEKLPNFYLPRKPGKTILDRCGWNDWYNTGNYINNFNYYGRKI